MVACGCNSSAMASGASSSDPVALQRGATSNGGRVVTVRVGSFNFGVDQNMLQRERWVRKHRGNFKRVCAEMVRQGNLDIMFGCELGGSGKGFRCASIIAKEILVESFGDISCAVVDNYIALCKLRDSAVVLHARLVKFTITVETRTVDAVITRFDVLRYDGGGAPQTVTHLSQGICILFVVPMRLRGRRECGYCSSCGSSWSLMPHQNRRCRSYV